MSKKPKLTPWFSGLVAPAHPGVYERRCTVSGIDPIKGPEPDEYGGYAYWDGCRWSPTWKTPKDAELHRYQRSGFLLTNESVWRGLAENPSPGAAPEACKHGVRAPHECKQCADEPSDAEIADWMERRERGISEPPGAAIVRCQHD